MVTNADLIDMMYTKGYVRTKSDAEMILEFYTDTIKDCLIRGEDFKIAGVGILRTIKMKGRMGRNPRTGEAVNIPEHKKVKFSESKVLRAFINNIRD